MARGHAVEEMVGVAGSSGMATLVVSVMKLRLVDWLVNVV
jgi:hypothetical protein